MRPLAVVMPIVCAVLASCASGQPAAPTPPPPPAASSSGASSGLTHDLLETVLRLTLGTWWGGVYVVKDGQTVLTYTNGLANETLVPFTEHTLFDMGDLSMQFTCVAVLKLEQDGKLAIDDPISKFYPDAPAATGAITLHQLMSHTSGLSDKAEIKQVFSPADRDATAMAVLGTEPVSGPGASWNYSKRGYSVLAAVIEKASGRPFDEYMRQGIFAPAGMKESGFIDGMGLNPANAGLRVNGPRSGKTGRAGLIVPAELWTWAGRGASGVISCLGDMQRWEAVLDTDVLLNKAQRDKITEVVRENYALGWYVTTTPRNTRRMWHGGSSSGFICISFRYIDEGVSMFVASNETTQPDTMLFALTDFLFPPLAETVSGQVFTGGPSVSARELPMTVVWSATAQPDRGVLLRITEAGHGEIARLNLSEGLARRSLAAITDVIRSTAGKGFEGTIVRVDPVKAVRGPDGAVNLSPDTKFEVRNYVRGIGPDGAQYEETRPTIGIIDPAAQGWPLMLRLDTKSAQELRQALEGAITK